MNEEFKMPAGLEDELRALTDRALSPRARYLHIALLFGTIAMTVLLVSLLVTEPHLPAPTRAAFMVMTAFALAWVGYAARTLLNRRVFLAEHRVIAARIALIASAVFTAGASWVAVWRESSMFMASAVLGATLCACALFMLVRAIRRARVLRSRRDALVADSRGAA